MLQVRQALRRLPRRGRKLATVLRLLLLLLLL